MRLLPSAATVALLILFSSACGGSSGGAKADGSAHASEGPTTTARASVTPGRSARIAGDASLLTSSTVDEGDVVARVDGRRCVVEGAPLVDCHAGTGSGGAFVVTVEGGASVPTDWNVVVRCGLDPAVPVASARGTFTPQFTELGLTAYGEVVGITLNGEQAGEAALAFLPKGEACPTIWGLGPIKRFSSFTGGLDPLNGSERPLQFARPDGTVVCVVAAAPSSLDVHAAPANGCAAS